MHLNMVMTKYLLVQREVKNKFGAKSFDLEACLGQVNSLGLKETERNLAYVFLYKLYYTDMNNYTQNCHGWVHFLTHSYVVIHYFKKILCTTLKFYLEIQNICALRNKQKD